MIYLTFAALAFQPIPETEVQLTVDHPAFDMALDLAQCIKQARSERREEFDALKTFEERQQRIAEVCEIERRNTEIVSRLREIEPEASNERLAELHKNLVLLAMFHRPASDLRSTMGHSDD